MGRPESPPRGVKRWQAVLAVVLGGVLAQAASLAVGAVVASWVFFRHGQLDQQALEQALHSLPVLAASIFAVSGTLALTALVTPWLAWAPLRESLGLRNAPWMAYLGAVIGALGLGPVSRLMLDGMHRLAPSLTLGSLDSLQDIASAHPLPIVWPLLALIPSLCEELFFRGLLQRALGSASWALVISALAFASFHLDPPHVVATLPVGLYLAWLAARTGSTWVPVVAHLTNNTLAIAAARHSDELPSETAELPLWTLAVSATLLAVARVLVRRGEPQARGSQ